MSLTGIGTAAFRHRVLRGREYVARAPEHVIANRDARLVADTRSDIEKWLGNPEPGRSALALSAIRDDILSKMDHQPSKGELGVVDNPLGCLRPRLSM